MASPSTTEYAHALAFAGIKEAARFSENEKRDFFCPVASVEREDGSAEELVIAYDEEECDGEADGNKTGPVRKDLLGFRELEVAPRIGEPQRNDQEGIHGAVHVVKMFPSQSQYSRGKNRNADEEVILADGFFLGRGSLFLWVDFLPEFLILLCHGYITDPSQNVLLYIV